MGATKAQAEKIKQPLPPTSSWLPSIPILRSARTCNCCQAERVHRDNFWTAESGRWFIIPASPHLTGCVLPCGAFAEECWLWTQTRWCKMQSQRCRKNGWSKGRWFSSTVDKKIDTSHMHRTWRLAWVSQRLEMGGNNQSGSLTVLKRLQEEIVWPRNI